MFLQSKNCRLCPKNSDREKENKNYDYISKLRLELIYLVAPGCLVAWSLLIAPQKMTTSTPPEHHRKREEHGKTCIYMYDYRQ